ncbi:MAG: caspase family protein [Deltaproteobacteria bacterium]|nr:caspase family protein [Deltaproteobacteria bacterium]
MTRRTLTATLLALVLAALAVAAPATSHALRPFGSAGGELQGRFRALIVWVQDYEHWTRLSAPKKDAERIAAALRDRYLFAPEDVELLGNPTQAELFKAIKSLATKARPGDSVLIVFAGHGHLETATGQGYWVPRDARRPSDAAELSYLSSAWVRDVLKGSEALHVAVVSDSCFSGALLSSRGAEASALSGDAYYSRMYQRRSFEGLTSGALETVDDAGAPGGHSPFAYYFALALESPDAPVFDLQDVFQRIRQGVKTLSKQTPLFGRLAGAPSDGGGFVFVARDGVGNGAVAAATPEPGRPSTVKRADEEPASPGPADTRAGPPAEAVKAYEAARAAAVADKWDEALRLGLKARFCEVGHFEGCAMLAEAYTQGLGTVADPGRANELYASANAIAGPACDRDQELACAILGESLVLGRGVAPDLNRGGSLLRKGCDLGSGEACGALAGHIAMGRLTGGPAAAVKLWEKGCRTGDAESCFEAGTAFEQGTGVKPDPRRAAELHGQGCDGGYRPACGSLGGLVLEGSGVARDLDLAAALGAHGCDAGDPRSCTVLGSVLLVGSTKLAVDRERALTLFKGACERDYADACFGVGLVLYNNDDISDSNPEEARTWLERGCKGDSGLACDLLGTLVDEGKGGDMDMRRAKQLFGKACKLGVAEACEKK